MTRRSFAKSAAAGAVFSASLVDIGCSGSQVITTLEVALDAVTVALPFLSSLAGIPPALSSAVVTYAGAVNQALGKSAEILAGTGTDAEKAALIAAAFAGIVAPIVPGQFQALASLIQTLANDVAAFLTSIPGKAVAAGLKSGAAHRTTWSSSEAGRLEHAKKTAASNAVVLRVIQH